jgi:hypothetical protein
MTPNYVDSILIKPGDPQIKIRIHYIRISKVEEKSRLFISANREKRNYPESS